MREAGLGEAGKKARQEEVLMYFKAAGQGRAYPQDTPSGCWPGADRVAGMDGQIQLQVTAKSGRKWKASQKKWGGGRLGSRKMDEGYE